TREEHADRHGERDRRSRHHMRPPVGEGRRSAHMGAVCGGQTRGANVASMLTKKPVPFVVARRRRRVERWGCCFKKNPVPWGAPRRSGPGTNRERQATPPTCATHPRNAVC